MVNILEKVSDKNDLCYINSKTKYSLGLSYVIKYNEKFLMIADTCDYEYDGYIIIKWDNIEEIEYNERAIFESKIIKNENGKPNIENVIDIKLDSYKTIFNCFRLSINPVSNKKLGLLFLKYIQLKIKSQMFDGSSSYEEPSFLNSCTQI